MLSCLTWWQRGPCWIFTFLISAGIIVVFSLYGHLSSSYTIPKNIKRKGKKLRHFCFSKELNNSGIICTELPLTERAGRLSDWKINCSTAENRTDPSNTHFLATAPTAICCCLQGCQKESSYSMTSRIGLDNPALNQEELSLIFRAKEMETELS